MHMGLYPGGCRPRRGGSPRAFGERAGPAGGRRRVVPAPEEWLPSPQSPGLLAAGGGLPRRPLGLRRAPRRGSHSPEPGTGADRAQGSVWAGGCPPGRGGSPPAFGGPRRGGWAEAGTPKQQPGSVAGGTPDPCQASVAGGGPPGALGAGARRHGGAPYPHRTTHWSRPPPAVALSHAGVSAWGRRLTATVRLIGITT